MGTFWAHLGTNQRNLSELQIMSFRRSQVFRRSDLGHAEDSNPLRRPLGSGRWGSVSGNPQGTANLRSKLRCKLVEGRRISF